MPTLLRVANIAGWHGLLSPTPGHVQQHLDVGYRHVVLNALGWTEDVAAAKAVVKKPVAVYVERVYPEGDFGVIGGI
jgi:hypothetical protein